MDAYEALKETFDDLFQQAVEEGCYTEDEAAELVESLDIYSLLQVVRHNATTVYSYITQGRQERSFNYRGRSRPLGGAAPWVQRGPLVPRGHLRLGRCGR